MGTSVDTSSPNKLNLVLVLSIAVIVLVLSIAVIVLVFDASTVVIPSRPRAKKRNSVPTSGGRHTEKGRWKKDGVQLRATK